mmetsp:Transcript_42726/g.117956  ORF Transcript_42726/g.117956 Transcript_42726/m.117956 type:complete len:290 (+) Transcript_42726:64-933(+)
MPALLIWVVLLGTGRAQAFGNGPPPPVWPERWQGRYVLLQHNAGDPDGVVVQSGETLHDWPRKVESHFPCMHPLADMSHYANGVSCRTWWLGRDLFLQLNFTNGSQVCCRWANTWNATPSTPDFALRGGAHYVGTATVAGHLLHMHTARTPYRFDVGVRGDGLPVLIDYHTPSAKGGFFRWMVSDPKRVEHLDGSIFEPPSHCERVCTEDWQDRRLFPLPGQAPQIAVDAWRYPHVDGLLPITSSLSHQDDLELASSACPFFRRASGAALLLRGEDGGRNTSQHHLIYT